MSDWKYRTGDESTRPDFKAPVPAGVEFTMTTYRGHDPDNMKLDCYWDWNSPAAKDGSVLAMAAGVVVQHFDPGGLKIDHGDDWFSLYLHMDQRAGIGEKVSQGEWIGRVDTIGTWAKHLHIEEEYGSHYGETIDMVNPVIEGHGPLNLDPGQRVTVTSTNGHRPTPNPPHLPGASPHHKADWPGMGKGKFYGRHADGGHDGTRSTANRASVKMIQQQLIWLGVVPGVRDVKSSWADGYFGDNTAKAVVAARVRCGYPHATWPVVGRSFWIELMSK